MNDNLLDFQFPTKTQTIIKVIGVGGGGGNAVNHMFNENIADVSFALCNTDRQDLDKSPIKNRIQLGKGLGAGNQPQKAKEAAEESIEDIKKLLNDGTKMVFITAGMGGGTGTGAAPIIANVAKSMGILTIGIVTIPFAFEGQRKIIQAFKGVMNIQNNVDALLIINNERLIDIYPDWTVLNAFAKADEILTIAAKSIIEIVTAHGYINLDFADVNTILRNGGIAIMSTGYGEGDNRVEDAIENALHSPLLNNSDVSDAKRILFNIYSSEEHPLMIEEMEAVTSFMSQFNSDIEVIWGTAIDNELSKKIKITLLASGFGVTEIGDKEELEENERVYIEDIIDKYYGEHNRDTIFNQSGIFGEKAIILSTSEFEDDKIIDILENTPVSRRDKEFYSNIKKMRKNI